MAAIVPYTIVGPGLTTVLVQDLLNLKIHKKFLRQLTTIEKPQPGRPKHIACCQRKGFMIDGGKVYFPRSAIRTHLYKFGLRAQNRYAMETPPREVQVESDPNMYVYQEVVIDYVMEGFAKAISPTYYIELGTGLGKTRIGCAIAGRCKVPTLILCPACKPIAEQWLETFQKLFPELVVGIYSNPTKNSKKVPPNFATHDIIIIIVNTFREKTPEFLEGCGLIIVDEAHEFQSAMNVKALWLATHAPRVLGLSATPAERSDEMDRHVFMFLGNPIKCADLPGFGTDTSDFFGEVTVEKYYCDEPKFCKIESTAIGTLGNLILDPVRLTHVCNAVDRISNMDLGAGKRHGIFVFAEHREYLSDIRDQLLERGHKVLVPEIDGDDDGDVEPAPGQAISILKGNVKQARVTEAQDAGAHIILTTYGYSRRGVSMVQMTAIVLATPRRSGMIQIAGRVFRKGSDETICRQIHDIVDMRTNLKSQHYERIKAFKKINLKILA